MPTTAEIHITAKDHTQPVFAAVRKTIEGTVQRLSHFRGELLALAGVAGFGAMIESAIASGASIEKLSKKLGASTEALSQFKHVAEVSHVAFDSVTRSFQLLEKNVSAASRGLGPAKKAFQALGVSAKQLKQLKVEEQFEVLADRFTHVHNAADRTRLAMQIFGKAGAEMIPILAGGSAAIREAREEADRLGLTLTEAGAHHLAEAHEAIVKLKHAFAGLANTLAIQFGPVLAKGAEALSFLLPKAVEAAIVAFIRMKEVVALALSSIFAGFEHFYRVVGLLPGSLGQPYREASRAFKALRQDLFAVVDGHEKLLAQRNALHAAENQAMQHAFPKALYEAEADSAKAAKAARLAAKKAAREAARALKAQERLAKQHADKMKAIFSESFFAGMESGFQGMVSSFKNSLQQMVSEAAAAQLTRAVFKSLPTGSGSQDFLGHLLQSAGSIASTLFGGFRANGGEVLSGRGYIVGERGPEVFISQQQGHIMPNSFMTTTASAPISIVMHVHTPDAPSFRRSSSQIRTDLGLALQHALKRNT